MRIDPADSAMFLREGQMFSVEHARVLSLAAEAEASSGFITLLGRFGAGGLAVFLMVVTRGLIVSGKANGKPWILVVLGLMIAGSFAYAGDVLGDVNALALELTSTVNDLGIGEATPAALGCCVAAILWLFPVKPGWRIFWGFMAYVTWSAADGSLPQNISLLVDNLVKKFAG